MSSNDICETRTLQSEGARSGDIKKLQELVKSGCDINRTQWSETLLHLVCKRGSKEVAEFIIENGGKSQIHVQNDIGWTISVSNHKSVDE